MNIQLYKKLEKNIFELFIYNSIDKAGFIIPNDYNVHFALSNQSTEFSDSDKLVIKEFLSDIEFLNQSNDDTTSSRIEKQRQQFLFTTNNSFKFYHNSFLLIKLILRFNLKEKYGIDIQKEEPYE